MDDETDLKYFDQISIAEQPKDIKVNEENIDNEEEEKDDLHLEGFSYEQNDENDNSSTHI